MLEEVIRLLQKKLINRSLMSNFLKKSFIFLHEPLLSQKKCKSGQFILPRLLGILSQPRQRAKAHFLISELKLCCPQTFHIYIDFITNLSCLSLLLIFGVLILKSCPCSIHILPFLCMISITCSSPRF